MNVSSTTWQRILVASLALAGILFWGIRVQASRPSDLFKKPVVLAPEFSFKDRSGKTLSKADLRDKVWVTDFIFTHCAGSCPVLSGKMKSLQEAWKGDKRFALVSFTTDPARDTVQALKKYAESLQADPDQWFFLTGAKKDLYSVIRDGFLLTAQEDPLGGPGFEFVHTTRMVLVDGRGMVRGFYDAQEEEHMKKLEQDIKFLIGKRGRS